MSERRRADMVLVELGLFESRARAQDAIAAGLVTVEGRPVRKASEAIPAGAAIEARAPHPWVSRGGVKLAAALEHFAVDPAGRFCLDIGSSTGGFTHVLLTRGARRVVAIDVGRDQLHASVRGHPALDSREETDARGLRPEDLAEPPTLVTFDVSFIPLRLVLEPVLALAADDATAIALIKPQFEAGRRELKKGIVRSPEVRAQVCEAVAGEFIRLGWTVRGVIPSPIAGGDGNEEFLIAAARGRDSVSPSQQDS